MFQVAEQVHIHHCVKDEHYSENIARQIALLGIILQHLQPARRGDSTASPPPKSDSHDSGRPSATAQIRDQHAARWLDLTVQRAGGLSTEDTLSCSSWPTSPGLRWEKRWVDLRLIPLLHSRLSQYIPGSDACRKNAFQVIAVDGVCSGVIQFPTVEECLDWLQAIASNISSLTKHNIIYMGWVDEKEQDSVQDRMYSPKFLALRGSSLFKFSAPPDNDLLDKRKHCFSVQTESGEDMFFSVELDCELLIWEKAFQMATFLEVERIQCKTYACIMESHLMGLTVDFSMGFVCFDAASKAVLWRYKFSQLKGSSDDGKSKIKFLFQNQDSKSIEAKELEFSNLFAVLHCIHAFFAAKVACLDPMFVESQGNATTTGFPSLSSISCNSQTPKLKYAT
ncbi:Gamma-1-syntrophin [Collichthys lucidus]|uniref:Gamma-1-syntrophin n=1 Tax=Collichthys lucidus TaxID=240159 RepID=A0A4U5V0K0_COLLU|nr:Gamma-1-syntrophin [Collichthys lucidus]